MRLFILCAALLALSGCGNDVEEIKDPETGKLLKRYEYFTDDSGQKVMDGEYKEWDSSGKLIKDYHYEMDTLEGKCVTTKEDGTVFENNFHRGKMDGSQLVKSSDGTLLSKTNYRMEIADGEQVYYYQEFDQRVTAHYSDGIETGEWKYAAPGNSFSLHFDKGLCRELLGTWLDAESDRSKLVFKSDESFEHWFPYFKYYGEPMLQEQGPFRIEGNQLILEDKRGPSFYVLIELKANVLKLQTEKSDFSPSEIWTYRRKFTQ